MYDTKLSSRSVIHDSAGSAGRTMAEDLENPEDKVRDNTISVRRSKQFMRTVTAPARSPRRTSHRLHSHRLCGGCAASRAPATHCRGRLGPIQYDPRRFRNCGARSPESPATRGSARTASSAPRSDATARSDATTCRRCPLHLFPRLLLCGHKAPATVARDARRVLGFLSVRLV